MINISKLYCDQVTAGDWLRYGIKTADRIVPKTASQRRPIVVWNITKSCNLKCIHCYNDSGIGNVYDEISTAKAKEVIDDLAEFGVPSILFSGGEPLMRQDLFELIEYTGSHGVRIVISTNGTLINTEMAQKIKQGGVSYVGISLDGTGKINDSFRGVDGAFDAAVNGIRNCRDAGVKVGVRLTLTRSNTKDIEKLFNLIESEGIERVCFYHLVPCGRGITIADEALTHSQSRLALDIILARARQLKENGRSVDILTVDNHVDGVYLYLKLLVEDAVRAENVLNLLKWNGGGMYSSGVGIGCIDFNGKMHPDQFWGHYDVGDIHEKPFSRIWTDPNEPLLRGLRNRRAYIKGRCRLCKFFDICGGSLRVRADLHFGDWMAPDPACYLTDDEIGLNLKKQEQLRQTNEIFKMPD